MAEKYLRGAIVAIVGLVLVLAACNAQQPQPSEQAANVMVITQQPATEQIVTGTPGLPGPQQTEEYEATAAAALTPAPTTPLPAEAKIDPTLLAEMQANSQHVEFFFRVYYDDSTLVHSTPDPSKSLAENNNNYWVERMNQTHAPIWAILEQQKQLGKVESYESFDGTANSLFVVGRADVLWLMAARSDTFAFTPNRHFEQPPVRTQVTSTPIQNPSTPMLATAVATAEGFRSFKAVAQNFDDGAEGINDPEVIQIPWNINLVGAPTMWAGTPGAGRVTGAGVTVGIIDAGVQYDSPSLRQGFRGYAPGPGTTTPVVTNYWYNAASQLYVLPTDPTGHGTHVLSLAVGKAVPETGNVQFGVAPDAKWMGCATPSYSSAELIRCLQWIRGPSSVPSTPAVRTNQPPEVVVFSIGTPDYTDELRIYTDDLVLNGIFFVPAVSEAQGGRPTFTPVDPIGAPGAYRSSFSVGAVNYAQPNQTPTVSYYAGQGPVPTQFSRLVKPDVAAPGGNPNDPLVMQIPGASNVSSTAIARGSGTSFAAPHVAGLAALLLERSNPDLSPDMLAYHIRSGTIYGTKGVLNAYLRPPRYTDGYGLINAPNAFKSLYLAGSDTCTIDFPDVSNTVILHEPERLACGGVINGFIQYASTGPGPCVDRVVTVDTICFKPDDKVRRGQFAKMIVLGLGVGYSVPTPISGTPTPTFSDVPANHFAFSYIESAYKAGIMAGLTSSDCTALGVANPCFGPNLYITKAQMATMLYKARDYQVPSGTQLYSDVSSGHWAYHPIQKLGRNGVMGSDSNCIYGSGTPTPTPPRICFNPNEEVTRVRAAAYLYSAIGKVLGTPGPTPSSND